MIRLTRVGPLSLELSVDSRGRLVLSRAVARLSSSQDLVDVSCVVATGRSTGRTADVGVLTLGLGLGSLRTGPAGATWLLEGDELDYLAQRLEDRQEQAGFSPAEFTQVRTDGRKELDMVYLVDISPAPSSS